MNESGDKTRNERQGSEVNEKGDRKEGETGHFCDHQK